MGDVNASAASSATASASGAGAGRGASAVIGTMVTSVGDGSRWLTGTKSVAAIKEVDSAAGPIGGKAACGLPAGVGFGPSYAAPLAVPGAWLYGPRLMTLGRVNP